MVQALVVLGSNSNHNPNLFTNLTLTISLTLPYVIPDRINYSTGTPRNDAGCIGLPIARKCTGSFEAIQVLRNAMGGGGGGCHNSWKKRYEGVRLTIQWY